jgi:DNA-binding transcriptional ArsR family regulator
MLDTLVTSKTRLKLLLKFFLNPEIAGYLRGLADEFGESTNAVRVELNRLEKAGIIESEKEGRTVMYKANPKHPLFPDMMSIVRKYSGLDQVAENVVKALGDIELGLVTGDYAKGIDSGIIDLVLVGENIDKAFLNVLIERSEAITGRKIRTLLLTHSEYENLQTKLGAKNSVVIWNKQENSKSVK